MKPVYVEKDQTLNYFICSFSEDNEKDEKEVSDEQAKNSNNENKENNAPDEYSITGISEIGERAFHAPWNVKRVFFDGNLNKIKKEAFKDADELEVFCCAEKGEENFLKGLKLNKLPKGKEFSVETLAFSGCVNLHTVIFPNCGTLKIEKNAFSDCKELRTVVAIAEEIDFTENPFTDCPEYLTFVCKKDSAVEKFARENGYRSVYVS